MLKLLLNVLDIAFRFSVNPKDKREFQLDGKNVKAKIYHEDSTGIDFVLFEPDVLNASEGAGYKLGQDGWYRCENQKEGYVMLPEGKQSQFEKIIADLYPGREMGKDKGSK